MSTKASAPPTAARVEIGTGLAVVGALVLVVHLGSIPAFIAERVIGFVSVRDFWPMVGGSVLLAAGLVAVAAVAAGSASIGARSRGSRRGGRAPSCGSRTVAAG